MKIQRWIGVTLSGLGLFLSSWIVIPAPTFFLLPLGVGAPEISPLLLLGNAVVLRFLLLQRQRYFLRRVVIAGSVCAVILSSLPLIQLPVALQQANTQMQSALDAHYLMQIPIDQKTRMRSHPVVLADLVTGLQVPTVQCDRQSFTTADGTRLALEIYRSTTTGLHPVLVTIYGGAWQRGEPGQNASFNSYMAAQGYTVVAIDYRHAPRYHFPVQVQDVHAALTWITQNAITYNINIAQIALIGWSAGAHLALLTAYQTESIPIHAVVSYYGPTSLTDAYRNPPYPDPIHTRAVLEAFLGGSPAQFPKQYELASPIHYIQPDLPPTLLIYGSRDHLVKPIFGQQLYNLLRFTGNRAVLISLPWAEHSFDKVFSGLGNQIALYYTERFLAWALLK